MHSPGIQLVYRFSSRYGLRYPKHRHPVSSAECADPVFCLRRQFFQCCEGQSAPRDRQKSDEVGSVRRYDDDADDGPTAKDESNCRLTRPVNASCREARND